jgi:hypothetical protein
MLSINSGPNVSTGNTNPVQNYEPDQGPDVNFQGGAIIDPRFVSSVGAAPGSKILALFANPYFALLDAVPQAANAARIAPAANVVANTPMVLATAQAAGLSVSIPIIPFGQPFLAQNIVKVLALDFGFVTGNLVAGNTTLTIPAGAWKNFKANQALIIAGAGTIVNTPLITTVVGPVTANTLTITLANASGQTINGAQVGTADITATAAQPYAFAGAIALSDPTQNIARGVSVTGLAGSSGGNFLVRGYDIYGTAMSELIVVGAGAVIVYGNKAFKYIASVTPSFTNAYNYTVGTADSFGFSIRSDFWEYMNIYWAGAFLSASTGWTVADATAPATTTTGDVRGTMQVGNTNKSGAGATGGSANGILRLAAFMSVPMYNAINATNLNYSTLFGSTQS